MGIYDRTSSQGTIVTYLVVLIWEGHGRPHEGDNV